MRRRGSRLRLNISPIPAINQQNLSFWLESQVEESFVQQGLNTSVTASKAWIDLVSAQPCTLKDNASSSWLFTNQKELENYNTTQVVNITNNYSLSAAENFSLGCFFEFKSQTETDSGFFAGGLNSTTTSFYLNSTNRPVLKIGNTVILNAASGYQVQTGIKTYITLSVKSHTTEIPGTYSICFNGVEQYSGSHTKIMPVTSVQQLGRSYSESKVITAKYKSWHFYRRAITAAESLSNYNALLTAYNL